VSSSVSCPVGTPKLIGGGGIVTQGATMKAALFSSAPNVTSGTPSGWNASAVYFSGSTSGAKPAITAYAICGV
jgi:hypothetical protein